MSRIFLHVPGPTFLLSCGDFLEEEIRSEKWVRLPVGEVKIASSSVSVSRCDILLVPVRTVLSEKVVVRSFPPMPFVLSMKREG